MGAQEFAIQTIYATGVLGQYTHSIEFDVENPFVIVFGPNGIGKTKFLEIIDSLSNLRWRNLLPLPFESATITYRGGSTLSVVKRETANNDPDNREYDLEFRVSRLGEEPAHWIIDSSASSGFEMWLRMETSWVPYSGTMWQDQADGELADLSTLEVRFRQVSAGSSFKSPRVPDAFQDFVSNIHTTLIETQRLKIEDPEADHGRRFGQRIRRTSSTIVEYAKETQQLLSDALAQNSRITQQLDRTFPSRMLTQGTSPESDEHEIRLKYAEQNTFRSRLAQIALIGLDPELSLPERELTTFEISMLDLYLKDADSKLESFEPLLEKISLLESVINSRLLGKTLHVDAKNGMLVQRTSDNVPITLDSLSSGEQHEIILMYNLLFNVKPGSLVLIDEPEISLHVSWQVNFISDVEKISRLAGFQFLVATHSPQIINTWWGYAKQLGPEDAEL